MKILVVSDMHGCVFSGEVMKEAYGIHNVDFILCLGDILYHGPRNNLPENYNPKRLIEIMNSFKDKIISVRGNCDAEVDQMVLNFPINADKNIFYMGDRKVFATHCHLFDYKDVPLNKGDIFISGHTHILKYENVDGLYILNPGSMSLPKANNPKTYAVLEESKFVIYNLDHTVLKSIDIA